MNQIDYTAAIANLIALRAQLGEVEFAAYGYAAQLAEYRAAQQ